MTDITEQLRMLEKRVAFLEKLEQQLMFNVAGTTKTIAGGIITKETGKITWHKVEVQLGFVDDLDTINGGIAGDILFISSASANVITLKDGTGNLLLTGDLALNSVSDLACLFYRGTNWYEVSFSNIA
jgi:hypothetical protein